MKYSRVAGIYKVSPKADGLFSIAPLFKVFRFSRCAKAACFAGSIPADRLRR